ncbi:MAG TPA: hypothetical protein VL728_16600 [Cyclobacteriaceae bacterium]|nr:hypothetical protein [Cyclobacteriaceae bacterium]
MPITPQTRKAIFETLAKALEKCSPPMVSQHDAKKQTMLLMGNKPVPYGYDKKIIPGMYFASIAQRSDSVAFYFFPIYYKTAEFKKVAPTLIKCLKGKTCFHFKKEEQVKGKELAALLKLGMKAWKAESYMK